MTTGATLLTSDLPGRWIGLLLSAVTGRVDSIVPRGYGSYCRVLHPPLVGENREASRWSEVCRITGRQPHKLMQWTAISAPQVGLRQREKISAPIPGNLDSRVLRHLVEILDPYTRRPTPCYFGLWSGWGYINQRPPGSRAAPDASHTPQLALPGRDYILYRGPLSAYTGFGCDDWGTWDPQSPNLLWPEDRSWFVATDVDLDSTIVAGTTQLIGRILDRVEIEAWEVATGDSLAYDADVINS